MPWNPSPADIISQHWSGTGDMGSLDYIIGADVNNAARFGLDGKFVLIAIRGHFSGGTGHNALTVNLDSGFGPNYDFGLKTFPDVGTDGDEVDFRIPAEELIHWIFDGSNGSDGSEGDVIVPTWTNPNTQRWGLEVLLVPVGLIDRVIG